MVGFSGEYVRRNMVKEQLIDGVTWEAMTQTLKALGPWLSMVGNTPDALEDDEIISLLCIIFNS